MPEISANINFKYFIKKKLNTEKSQNRKQLCGFQSKRFAVDLPTTCFKIMARVASTFKHITACSPASIVYSKPENIL